MTRIEAAIEKLRNLPKTDQSHFVALLLDEEMWNEAFERTAFKLDKLGSAIAKDIDSGHFKPMKG